MNDEVAEVAALVGMAVVGDAAPRVAEEVTWAPELMVVFE